MNTEQKALITLARSALTGEKCSLPDNMELKAVYETAKAHGIAAMAYYGALNCRVDGHHEIMEKLLALTRAYIFNSHRQMLMVEKIFGAFEQAHIAYMPLKGTVLKNLYPKPEMRIMGDADILVRMPQYEKVREIMLELGFQEGNRIDHEMHWLHGLLHVELHNKLIPSYNKDYYAYFGDGWQLATQKVTDSRWGMTAEDAFIYLFTHFAKHYRDAGIGIKHMTDLWLYRRNNAGLDEVYIRRELKKLQLDVFCSNILDTLAVWFDDQPGNEKTELITQTILASGAGGKYETAVLSSALKDRKAEKTPGSLRLKKLVRIVFEPYDQMTEKYPVLQKCPLMLPFCWIANITAFFKRKSLSEGIAQFRVISNENVDRYQRALNLVGLDFHFEEQE